VKKKTTGHPVALEFEHLRAATAGDYHTVNLYALENGPGGIYRRATRSGQGSAVNRPGAFLARWGSGLIELVRDHALEHELRAAGLDLPAVLDETERPASTPGRPTAAGPPAAPPEAGAFDRVRADIEARIEARRREGKGYGDLLGELEKLDRRRAEAEWAARGNAGKDGEQFDPDPAGAAWPQPWPAADGQPAGGPPADGTPPPAAVTAAQLLAQRQAAPHEDAGPEPGQPAPRPGRRPRSEP
jgi:hypothetical protein